MFADHTQKALMEADSFYLCRRVMALGMAGSEPEILAAHPSIPATALVAAP